jgi:hypothetical protein
MNGNLVEGHWQWPTYGFYQVSPLDDDVLLESDIDLLEDTCKDTGFSATPIYSPKKMDEVIEVIGYAILDADYNTVGYADDIDDLFSQMEEKRDAKRDTVAYPVKGEATARSLSYLGFDPRVVLLLDTINGIESFDQYAAFIVREVSTQFYALQRDPFGVTKLARDHAETVRKESAGINFGKEYVIVTMPFSDRGPAGFTQRATEYAQDIGLPVLKANIKAFTERGRTK